MEADILKSKKESISCSRSMEADIFEKVLFINLFYFVVSIGIAIYAIIKYVPFIIKATYRYFVYFETLQLMLDTSNGSHLMSHLFFIH